jgi:photosystem II stability/assembly factor-like uncharacterized protein
MMRFRLRVFVLSFALVVGLILVGALLFLSAGITTAMQRTGALGPARRGAEAGREVLAVAGGRNVDGWHLPHSSVSRDLAGGWQSYPLHGGEMTSIAVGDATLGQTGYVETVYVGTRDAGVFKSVDGGATWQPARAGLSFFPIRTLVTDPANADVLYAGTDFDGIWKSTDGGQGWFKSSTGLDEGLVVFAILVDPQESRTLYAGLAGGIGLAIGNIYKSEDAGATWVQQDAGLPRVSETSTHTNGVFTLAIHPDDSDLLYAGTNFDGAYRSTDGGEHWTPINIDLPFEPNSTEKYRSVNALALDPHHAWRLSGIVGGEYYVWQGEQWRKIGQGTFDTNTGLFRDYLYFHPTEPDTLYSAGDRFSKSIDGGVHWTQYLGWNDSGDVPEVAFHPDSPDTIYAATSILMTYPGGVFKSRDQGETWNEASQGITAVAVESVAIDPTDSKYLYVGEGHGHFYRSQDGGSTWTHSYVGGFEVSDVLVDPFNPARLYVAATDLYTSTDRGVTLQQVDGVEYVNVLAVATGGSVYAGASFGRGIYRSGDGGIVWEQKNDGLPLFGNNICPVLSLAVDPRAADTIWAGMQYGGGIARTVDGGEHWQVMGLTETNFVDAIAVHPLDSDEILAGGGFSDGRIYKSVDGGITWQEKASGIAFVQSIAYDPRDPDWVYAASEGYGMLRSFNGGESWHLFSDGIFYPLLYTLDVTQEDPPLLITGSFGSGLYSVRPGAPRRVFLPTVVR